MAVMRRRHQMHDLNNSLVEDLIESTFLDLNHGMGFSREAVFRHLFSCYGIRDKETTMLKINTALKKGMVNGSLKKIRRLRNLETYRLVQKRTMVQTLDRPYPQLKLASHVANVATNKRDNLNKTAHTDIKKVPSLRQRSSQTRRTGSQPECTASFSGVSDICTAEQKSTELEPQKDSLASTETPNRGSSYVSTFSQNVVGIQPKRSCNIPNVMPHLAWCVMGIVVLNDGRKLIAESTGNFKLFAPDMRLLSTTELPSVRNDSDLRPALPLKTSIIDIASFSENEAVIIANPGLDKYIIQFIDTSSDLLPVTHSLVPEFIPNNVSACGGCIYVIANLHHSPILKMSRTGEIYWSSGVKAGLKYAIECFVMDDTTRVIVSEYNMTYRIMLLNGESGDVLAVHQSQELMRGITTDSFNNIYVTYPLLGSVSVMKNDLSEEKVILTKTENKATHREALAHDLDEYPENLVFDHQSKSLLITSGMYCETKNIVQIYEFNCRQLDRVNEGLS